VELINSVGGDGGVVMRKDHCLKKINLLIDGVNANLR